MLDIVALVFCQYLVNFIRRQVKFFARHGNIGQIIVRKLAGVTARHQRGNESALFAESQEFSRLTIAFLAATLAKKRDENNVGNLLACVVSGGSVREDTSCASHASLPLRFDSGIA